MLVEAETFPHEPSGVVTNVCLADVAAGDHSKTRWGTWWEAFPVCEHAALGQSVSAFPVGPEIRAGLDSVGFREARELAGGRHMCRKGRQAGVSRARPRARRPARIFRPALVAMRARKPCLRLRLIFDGWNVCFI